MQKRERSGFIKSAVIVAAGGFVAKVIGALYRIPLTNFIGGTGIGLYQMVYPIYCLLLTVSATGIPSSIAKLTAERIGRGESAKPLFQKACKLFLWIGAISSALMVVFASTLAKAQGSEEVLFGYYMLAPSVLLVSAISVFRGYFQGKNRMKPTAASEIIEQVVKVAFGLFFAWRYRGDVAKAVVFLLLAVTISEAVALLVMVWIFKRENRREKEEKKQNEGGRVAMKHILRMSLPVSIGSILIPLSSLIDSVLAVRLLGAYTDNAVGLYGLFSGGAVTIINLPVSICYGIAAASIPAVAMAKAKAEKNKTANGSSGEVRKKWLFSLGITVLISLPAAVGLYYFATPIANMIYRSLSGEELEILSQLIRIFSLSACTLSCAQTLSACLTAQGKPQHSAMSMGLGMAVKTAVYVWLIRGRQNSVFGLAYATNVGYLVAFLLDLMYNFYVSRNKGFVNEPKKKRGSKQHGDHYRAWQRTRGLDQTRRGGNPSRGK